MAFRKVLRVGTGPVVRSVPSHDCIKVTVSIRFVAPGDLEEKFSLFFVIVTRVVSTVL